MSEKGGVMRTRHEKTRSLRQHRSHALRHQLVAFGVEVLHVGDEQVAANFALWIEDEVVGLDVLQLRRLLGEILHHRVQLLVRLALVPPRWRWALRDEYDVRIGQLGAKL